MLILLMIFDVVVHPLIKIQCYFHALLRSVLNNTRCYDDCIDPNRLINTFVAVQENQCPMHLIFLQADHERNHLCHH